MKSSDESTLIEFKIPNIEESSTRLEKSAKVVYLKSKETLPNLTLLKGKSLEEKIDELVQLKEFSLEKKLQVIESEYTWP
jgi:hypothetical protein